GIFPMISSGSLLLLTSTIAVQALVRWHRTRRASGQRPENSAEGEWSPIGKMALRANSRLIMLCAAMAALILLTGHLPATFLFVAACLLVLRPVAARAALAYAAAATLFVYAIFDLAVPQPWPT